MLEGNYKNKATPLKEVVNYLKKTKKPGDHRMIAYYYLGYSLYNKKAGDIAAIEHDLLPYVKRGIIPKKNYDKFSMGLGQFKTQIFPVKRIEAWVRNHLDVAEKIPLGGTFVEEAFYWLYVMKKKKSVQKTWRIPLAVKTRANRGKGTSAPTKEELKVYENHFKRVKHRRTLVLGGTPELRDLAIKHGSETVAVDISPTLLPALTSAMKYKDSDKNRAVVGDWLEMDKFLESGSFDVALADASFNNVAINRQTKLLKITNELLKKGGYFITRQVIYDKKQAKSFDEISKSYRNKGNTIIGLLLETGLYGSKAYNKRKRELSLAKSIREIKRAIKKADKRDYDNLYKHASLMTIMILPKKEWENKAKKYFVIKNIESLKKYTYTKTFPIYVLKKK